MGNCQLWNGEGQTKHIYLVFLAYSSLMRQLWHDRARDWAHVHLTTIGEAGRLMFRETLAKTFAWVVERTRKGLSLEAPRCILPYLRSFLKSIVMPYRDVALYNALEHPSFDWITAPTPRRGKVDLQPAAPQSLL
jgi:hypothetical protein